jgi:hypothetical protein
MPQHLQHHCYSCSLLTRVYICRCQAAKSDMLLLHPAHLWLLSMQPLSQLLIWVRLD